MKILGSAIFGLRIFGGDGKDGKLFLKKLDIFFVTIQIRDLTGRNHEALAHETQKPILLIILMGSILKNNSNNKRKR